MRLAVDPFGRFGVGAATADRAVVMVHGVAPPLIGGDAVAGGGELELLGRVIGPERAALGAERAGAAREAGRGLDLELCRPAMTASFQWHCAILLPVSPGTLGRLRAFPQPACTRGAALGARRARIKREGLWMAWARISCASF